MIHRATPSRARSMSSPLMRTCVAAAACVAVALVLASVALGSPRHRGHWGVVPVRGGSTNALVAHDATLRPHVGPKTLSYGGGRALAGTGGVTGTPRVYLVVWGDWGSRVATRGVAGAAYDQFSNDPSGEVPQLEAFFAGLGTNGETWSPIAAQYCASSSTATEPINATSCVPGTAPIAIPDGTGFAGLVVDTTTYSDMTSSHSPRVPAAPTAATATQLATEAQAAAIATNDSSRNAVYVVLSAPGSHPDQFNAGGNFCGWHDDTADTAAHIFTPSPTPDVAFINMPYVTDAGFACGAHAVNQQSAGASDGITIVAGHEYAEWLTDPFPGAGWSNATTGDEIGDECMWIGPGQQGAMVNLSLSTGAFPVQAMWSNVAEACVTTTGSSVRVGQLRRISSLQSGPVWLNIRANSSDAARRLVFTAVGLPRGVVLNPSTGRISGHVTGPVGLYRPQFTVTDTAGAPTTQVITWIVASPIRFGTAKSVSTLMGARTVIRIHARDLIGHRSIRYTASGLPRGLTINPRTGVISGVVRAAVRTYRIRVTAIDSGGAVARQLVVVRVR
jgi:hypothetical protein